MTIEDILIQREIEVREQSYNEGIAEGRNLGVQEAIRTLLKKHSVNEVANLMDLPLDRVLQVQQPITH